MAKPISIDSATLQLHLTQEQKARLMQLAAENGSPSVSAFIASIADGRLRVINHTASTLLDYIQAKMAGEE